MLNVQIRFKTWLISNDYGVQTYFETKCVFNTYICVLIMPVALLMQDAVLNMSTWQRDWQALEQNLPEMERRKTLRYRGKKIFRKLQTPWQCNLCRVALWFSYMKGTCSGCVRDGSLSESTSVRAWTECCSTLFFSLTSLRSSCRMLCPF